MSATHRSALALFALVGAAVLLAGLATQDKILESAVRVVYLHGASVWAALLAFAGAAAAGLAGFILKRPGLHAWSVGLGRSGTVFWLTSLLLSLAAMQASWNGLFLAEPRWHIGVRFGVLAVLLQLAGGLLQRPRLTSGLNVVFFAGILVALLGSESVMHPSSPVFTSHSVLIRVFFIALLILATAAAGQLARLSRPHD